MWTFFWSAQYFEISRLLQLALYTLEASSNFLDDLQCLIQRLAYHWIYVFKGVDSDVTMEFEKRITNSNKSNQDTLNATLMDSLLVSDQLKTKYVFLDLDSIDKKIYLTFQNWKSLENKRWYWRESESVFLGSSHISWVHVQQRA